MSTLSEIRLNVRPEMIEMRERVRTKYPNFHRNSEIDRAALRLGYEAMLERAAEMAAEQQGEDEEARDV